MKPEADWADAIDAAIIVTDENGIILAMNRDAEERLAQDGGRRLVGSNVFDCHPGESREKIARLYAEQKPNHYTIAKDGQKRIIHQMPWFRAGRFAGYVELSLPIPPTLPHFDRG